MYSNYFVSGMLKYWQAINIREADHFFPDACATCMAVLAKPLSGIEFETSVIAFGIKLLLSTAIKKVTADMKYAKICLVAIGPPKE